MLELQAGTILHQVNCCGAVGGLAGSLHRCHPAAFTDYFLLCEKYHGMNLGSFYEGHASNKLSIVHVFGQNRPGANTIIESVRLALSGLATRPLLQPIYAPYLMGCGLGGGDWEQYLALLQEYMPSVIIMQRLEDAP